jgi:glycosyltransferase involved in cell wall biosynthesis
MARYDKKKVLSFFSAFWECGAVTSGGEQMFIKILSRIRNEMDELSCITSIKGKNVISSAVPDVVFLTSPSYFDKFGMMGSYLLRTIFSFRCLTLKPDVVYSSSDFFPDVIPAFFLKLFQPKVKWVQCVFHIYPDWRIRPGSKISNFAGQYLQQFSLILARRADIVLNINQDVRNYLVKKGFYEESLVVIPPGIDPQAIDNIPSAPENTGYDGIFLGRLNINKGALDLIDIWANVVKELPGARLGIIGGGDALIIAKIKAKISHYDIASNIDLLGFLENERAFSIVKVSTVFLFPSREEGFGIAIVEAMHCGLPVVAWNLPVYAEHFPVAVETIEVEKFSAFAQKVVQLLSHPEKRVEKAKQGKACAEKFTWEKTAKKFNECILNP